MLVDFALLIIVALLGVGLTVVGGVVTSSRLGVRLCFLIGGPLLVICTIWQGTRQISAQRTSDEGFMHVVQESGKERQRSDAKIDALYALLRPELKETIPIPHGSPRPPENTPKPTPKSETPASPQQLLPPNNAKVSIVSQTPKTSTRADADYETELVVQTTETFTSLKMAVECDKPLVYGAAYLPRGSVQMMISSGVLTEHPNVFVYSYGSSTPPFSPSDPLIIDVWTKEPVTCNKVATF
jgi:hypothetical protein